MLGAGEVISYLEMCQEEGVNLQRGMNYKLRGDTSVIMSLRRGAPYADRVEENGKVLIYEGHDVPTVRGGPDPKTVDQPMYTPTGGFTQNGLFYAAARRHAKDSTEPDRVRVYEKLRTGIWVFNGVFRLLDSWQEKSDGRNVFKFRFELDPEATPATADPRECDVDQTRLKTATFSQRIRAREGPGGRPRRQLDSRARPRE